MKLANLKCFEMDLKKVWKWLHGRRAISPVISQMILTVAVIAVGFVVLGWTQYRSSVYNEEYSEVMDADIARLKERLAFEYVFFNESESKLSVYLLNCGTVDDVTIQTVYVRNNTWFETFTKSQINLRFLNETSTENLDVGEEGYFVLSSLDDLEAETSYSVRAVTGRGSTFGHTFIP